MKPPGVESYSFPNSPSLYETQSRPFYPPNTGFSASYEDHQIHNLDRNPPIDTSALAVNRADYDLFQNSLNGPIRLILGFDAFILIMKSRPLLNVAMENLLCSSSRDSNRTSSLYTGTKQCPV